ncbi:MAG: helix-turn-helix domain-containing protein [Rhizomicrobium sp.]
MTSTPSEAPDDRLAVSPAEACRLLSIGRTHLYELLDSDHLQSIKIGRSRRILMKSIHDFLSKAGKKDAA